MYNVNYILSSVLPWNGKMLILNGYIITLLLIYLYNKIKHFILIDLYLKKIFILKHKNYVELLRRSYNNVLSYAKCFVILL